MKKLIILFIVVMPLVAATQTVRKTKHAAGTVNTFKNWLGKWERILHADGGTLEIKSITNHYLLFEMFVNSGGHTGEIEGKAVIKQNTAVYYTANRPGPCKLTFHLTGTSSINIDQDGCDAFGGMGTYFGGKFLNVKHLPKQAPETLTSLHVLPPPAGCRFPQTG